MKTFLSQIQTLKNVHVVVLVLLYTGTVTKRHANFMAEHLQILIVQMENVRLSPKTRLSLAKQPANVKLDVDAKFAIAIKWRSSDV
jgi:hypothetical protein